MSPAHWVGGARTTMDFNNSPSAKKLDEARKRAGKKKRGAGGGKAFPQFCVSRMPSGGRKCWAGQSAKSSGFCWKKVLTSSSRHHHIELSISLGASPLVSAGTFARKSNGFLKSIESFCWLIWWFVNLKSLLVLKKQKPIFFRQRRKAKRDFIKLSV